MATGDPRVAPYLDSVRRSLERTGALPEPAWRAFADLLTLQELAREEFFARAGEPAVHIGFVATGVLREYYLTADGREYNKAFVPPGFFTGSLFDLLSAQPSTAFIQALANTVVLRARYADFVALYDRFAIWERFGRITAEQLFVKKARREYEFLTMDAATRYRSLLAQYPGIEELVPQYHIASYLGITPVALSRIRKSL